MQNANIFLLCVAKKYSDFWTFWVWNTWKIQREILRFLAHPSSTKITLFTEVFPHWGWCIACITYFSQRTGPLGGLIDLIGASRVDVLLHDGTLENVNSLAVVAKLRDSRLNVGVLNGAHLAGRMTTFPEFPTLHCIWQKFAGVLLEKITKLTFSKHSKNGQFVELVCTLSQWGRNKLLIQKFLEIDV